MERRVFGCSQFSDLVFKNSLTILEKVLDHILNDQDSTQSRAIEDQEGNKKVFKIGFYASETSRNLVVMVEIFDNDEVYQERFKDVLP
jgi:hypothetical protein